jgi:hypothetical protein
MPKQNWEERFEKEIICHCDDTCEDGLEGEKHTISNPEKIKSFISKLLSQTEQEVKERILKVLDDMFPESEFTRWNNFSNEWECLITKNRLKEITDLINKL